MEVKAKKDGYYGLNKIKAGTVFKLKPIKGLKRDATNLRSFPHEFKPEDQFSSVWMEKYDRKAKQAEKLAELDAVIGSPSDQEVL